MIKQLFLKISSATLVIPLVVLSGCQSMQKLKTASNVYEFNSRTPTEAGVPDDVLKRAAFTAQRRGYRYFTISDTAEGPQTASAPVFGINYGRDPYGFSDPGADSTGGGISFDLPLNTRRTHWVVTMLHNPEEGKLRVYDVNEIVAKK